MKNTILHLDANNTRVDNSADFKTKGVHGQSIRNTQANRLFNEGVYEKKGGYALGNDQDIRLVDDRMVLFVNPLKKFVTIGIKK